jgi:hypothetical protein
MMARTMTVRAVNSSDIIDARGQMLRLITATAFILIYSVARAGGLPAYDTEAACEDLAGTSAKQQLVTGLTAAVFLDRATATTHTCPLRHLFLFIGADPNTG